MSILSRWMFLSPILVLPIVPDSAGGSSPDREIAPLIKQSIDDGRIKQLDEKGFREMLKGGEPAAWLDASLKILEDHPEYTMTLVKRERVRDSWPSEPDVIALMYRSEPLATYCSWLKGPRKGRRVLYNKSIRPRELLARETGLLGLMSVWIGLDNPLARRDSNHTVLELGLAHPVRQARADLMQFVRSGGKFDPSDGKWIEVGGHRYWEYVMALPGPPEYYTAWGRLRFHVDTGIIDEVEIRDKAGTTLELASYRDVKWVRFPANQFSDKNPAHGL